MWPFSRKPAPPVSAGEPRPPHREPFISQFRHVEPMAQDAAPPLDVRLAPCRPAPGVVPESARMAHDSALEEVQGAVTAYAAGNAGAYQSWLADGLGFMGYPYLSQMAMRAEFRKPCDVLAREATREWIRLKSTKNIDPADYDTDEAASAAREAQARETAKTIRALEDEMKRLDIRRLLYRMVLDSLLNGVGYLWIDIAGRPTDATGQNVPLKLTRHGVAPGTLNGFRRIDPVWTSPNFYNADSPYRPGFYEPDSYWVQGSLTHRDRLLKMVPYEVPDIFRPAFNFGGLSLTQQLRPYVHNFLRTRNSVSNITANFSKLVLKTDMTGNMGAPQDGGMAGPINPASVQGRATFMQQVSEGQDTIVADNNAEDVSIIATPLGGLSDLQAQAMEAMASIPGIPLVKLFGITPNGLNASSEGEIRVFYDEVAAFQEAHIRPVLEQVLRLLQLNLFGDVDEAIDFEFATLWQLDAAQAATMEKTKAETDRLNIEAGKLTPDEARMREEQDPDSLYRGVNLSGRAPGPAGPSGRTGPGTSAGHLPDRMQGMAQDSADDPGNPNQPRDRRGRWTSRNTDETGPTHQSAGVALPDSRQTLTVDPHHLFDISFHRLSSFELQDNKPSSGTMEKTVTVDGKTFDFEQAQQKGMELDPSDRGRALTKAGRALQKHGNRPGSTFPRPSGPPQRLNEQGQRIFEELLSDPDAVVFYNPKHRNLGRSFHVFTNNGRGRGIAFHFDHTVSGFREPLPEHELSNYKDRFPHVYRKKR